MIQLIIHGDKTQEDLINRCDEIVKYFIQQECKAIVIACNTASAKVVDILRERYPAIPFVAIEPAYKMVHDFAYDKHTLIMATKGTIESEKFNMLYTKYDNHKTYILPCVGLADIIEAGAPSGTHILTKSETFPTTVNIHSTLSL